MASHRSTRLALAWLLGAAVAVAPPLRAQQPTSANARDPISFMTGGIGEDEAATMRGMSAQFPVRMTFSRHNSVHNTDEFVADVNLRVTDSAGRTVLNLTAQGPIFLLRLPDGAYAVEAEHNGETKMRRFDVTAGRHQDLAFSWPG
jgi:hypothetical protein